MPTETRTLSDARNIYDNLAASYAGEHLISLNKLILKRVCEATKPSLTSASRTVKASLADARSTLSDTRALPSSLDGDISTMPARLGVDALPPDLTARLGRIVDALKTAVADPTCLYPRLACGGMPVDPAKLMKIVKQYRVLDALDGVADGGGGGGTADRDIRTSADAVASLSTRVEAAVKPISECIETFTSAKHGLEAARDKIGEMVENAEPLQNIVNEEKRLVKILTYVKALLAKNDDETDSDSDSDDDDDGDDAVVRKTDAVESRSRAMDGGNVVSMLDDGVGTINRVRDSTSALTEAGGLVATFTDAMRSVWDEVKELFSKLVAAARTVANALRVLIAGLPRFIAEAQNLFVPRGLYALVLRPSDETRALVDDLRELEAGLPDAGALMQKTDGTKVDGEDGGECVTRGTDVMERMGKVSEMPGEVGEMVQRVADEMPEQVEQASKAALAEWVRETGAEVAQDALGNVMDSVGVDGQAGEALMNAAGGLFNKIF